jgi:hypothetical protein
MKIGTQNQTTVKSTRLFNFRIFSGTWIDRKKALKSLRELYKLQENEYFQSDFKSGKKSTYFIVFPFSYKHNGIYPELQ